MGKKLLLVDDEKAILKSFQRAFHGGKFQIFTAEDGRSALELLAREPVDVIISDMRMPEMNGHQLLRQVRDRYPGTIRLILSGHAEADDIAKAMLDGSCKLYILKPWDNRQLAETINQLLAAREQLSDRKLLTLINDMEGLCSLPPLVGKLMTMIDSNASVREIAAVLEQDPVMAARVLHMANSAFYGRRTGSINQAIVYLGLSAVKNIVLLTTLCGATGGLASGQFARENLWHRAVLTGRLVNRLYSGLTGGQLAPASAAAGLLSGIGLIALVHRLPDTYRQIATALDENPELALADLERRTIGVTHPEVGGYLLDWWNLPQPLVESALFHHQPFHAGVNDRQLVAVVHLACHYAERALQPAGAFPLDERVFPLLNTTPQACESLLKDQPADPPAP